MFFFAGMLQELEKTDLLAAFCIVSQARRQLDRARLSDSIEQKLALRPEPFMLLEQGIIDEYEVGFWYQTRTVLCS